MARNLVLILAASLVFVACDEVDDTDPCEGITCSGHGTCSLTNNELVCTCDEGYSGHGYDCDWCKEGYYHEDDVCVEADNVQGCLTEWGAPAMRTRWAARSGTKTIARTNTSRGR